VAGPTSSHKAYIPSDDDDGKYTYPSSNQSSYQPQTSTAYQSYVPLSQPQTSTTSYQSYVPLSQPQAPGSGASLSQPHASFYPSAPTTASYGSGASLSQPQASGSFYPSAPVQTSISRNIPSTSKMDGGSIKSSIISSQQFDGSWEEHTIKNILGDKSNEALTPPSNCNIKLWIAALAIATLELKCKDTKSSWEIVANKARTWMSKYLVTNEKMDKNIVLEHVSSLITQAEQVLQKLNF